METIRTLIVDDEARIRRGIDRLVRSCGEGWEVAGTAGDGVEALDFLRRAEGAVDLLITDVKMPEMDGLTLIKEAKKEFAFYPLLISGYEDFSYVRTALREGALDYLLKPVDREQFRLRMMEIRTAILSGRQQTRKRGEMERDTEKLKTGRQIQMLNAITSAGIDMSTLGDWVEAFPKGRYQLLYIRLDTLPVKTRGYTAKDWQAYFYALENIMAEVVANHGPALGRRGWCWRGGESDFWSLLYRPDTDTDGDMHAAELAAELRSAVQTHTPFSVSIAYGEAFEDFIELPEARRRSLALMNYRFLHGGNQVFTPALQASRQHDSRMKDLMPIAQKLKRSVEQANAAEAEECAGQLCDELDRLGCPAQLQTAIQNVILLIHSAGLESCGGFTSALPIEEEFRQASRAANLHELKMIISHLIAAVIRDIRAFRESGSHKPVEQAKAWIVDHLGDEVTIKKIADHVFMNPTYFSEYFKMQTGETILDYLTRQRMERAKELLRDPHLKLQDLCGRVGYQDVKYFSRLFKQWTGQTPSKFRERSAIYRGGDKADEIEP